MAKEYLDKYYTPKNRAAELIATTLRVLKENGLEVTDVIEPSAGNGAFSTQIKCTAYDIVPDHKSIIKADFTKLKIEHLVGRLFIGNPPFGKFSSTAKKFVRLGLKYGDYVAFIMPVSQHELPIKGSKLLYSKRLDIVYSSHEDIIPACFNIYVRTDEVEVELVDVKVIEYHRRTVKTRSMMSESPDYIMCSWGNVGKRSFKKYTYVAEIAVFVKNKVVLFKVLDIMAVTDWKVGANSRALSVTIPRVVQVLKSYGIK